jgi:phosphoserine phosphatase RsbU/P
MDDALNQAPCGFLSIDDHGCILEANATLLALLGFAPGELIGNQFETVLTISSRIFYQTHLFPLLALHGKAEEIFITLQAKDKLDIPVLVYAKRAHSRNDYVLVPVWQRQKYEQEILAAKRAAEDALRTNQDLLDAKNQLQSHAQELDRRIVRTEQQNRELLQVTNILFHDLREPLRKIETFAGMIHLEKALDEQSRLSLSKIQSACLRGNQLLRALQEFVSVETADDQVETVQLNVLVAEAFQSVSQAHPDCQARFVLSALPEIQGYPRQLSLLFQQLFDNAFKFRRTGVDLEIHVSGSILQENSFQTIRNRYRYIDFAQIYVSDNGTGIPRQYWDSVFELLKKLDLHNPQPGCGLAICRKVISNHYGSIVVDQNPSPGTTFKMLLPLKQEQFVMEGS